MILKITLNILILILRVEANRRVEFGVDIETYSKELYTLSHECVSRGHGRDYLYKFDDITSECYKVGERGPCGINMVFKILNSQRGRCDCEYRCGRPMIFWAPHNQCYPVNERGPCSPHDWLIFSSNGEQPICERNPCVHNTDGGQIFWFLEKGTCQRTTRRGSCHGENLILFNQDGDYRPSCAEKRECEFAMELKFGCLPGNVKDYNGGCIKIN